MKETKRRKEEERKRYKARRVLMAPSHGHIRDRREKLEDAKKSARRKERWWQFPSPGPPRQVA